MIDLVSRPDRPMWDDGVQPRTVNELIQARIDGRLTRRDMIRRAAQLGIAAPVIGVMLHATSDMVRAAPNPGRAMGAAARLQQTVPSDKPTAPEGTPQTGGTLSIGTNQEPDTLNPYVTQLVTSSDILAGVMSRLMKYDSTQQLQPDLATGFEISEDGLTYTFALRGGVKFHNGDAFTAQDVIDTWKMIMNPDFGAFDQQGWDKIKDITSPDAERLVITTTEVYAPFLSDVGSEFISPSKELAKGPEPFKQEFGRAPVGSGPMKFVEWTAKQQITLEKFPEYFGGAAKLDKIIIRVLPDDNTQLVQLRTGEIQMVGGAGALGATRVDEALGIENITVLEHPTLGWQHMDLKHIDFLRETKVRQALDFATPTQQIIDKLLKGRAVVSVADQAPGSWAYNPDIQPRPYDTKQAEALLDEVGLTKGSDGVRERDGKKFEMELWATTGSAETQQIVQVIAQSWNGIGIKTSPQFQDVSTIWGPEGYQFTDKMTACFYSWFNSNDPDDMFYWHSSQIPDSPTGTGGNLPAYFHEYNFQAQIDDLTSRAAKTTDQEERKQLYFQIQQLLHDEVPVIFMYWEKSFPAIAKNIGGFWPSAFNRLLWNVEGWYLTQ